MRKKSGFKERVCNWLKGRFRRALFAAGIVAGWGCKMLQAGQAYAAEELQVTELCVVRDEDGICASCTYRDPDGNSSILQLYLEKMDEQGAFFPLAYVDLERTGEETKTARTLKGAAQPGIYRAVILQQKGEGMPVVRFRDSGSFEVKESGKEEKDPKGGDRPGDEMGLSGEGSCPHSLEEVTYLEATPCQDGVLEERCETCGQVFGRTQVPNSAYSVFLKEAADRIMAAAPGEQAVIQTDRWMSFDERVLDAMAERRDISILVQFRYQGVKRQVLIPETSDVSGLGDENGFCGFCYLGQRYMEKFDE